MKQQTQLGYIEVGTIAMRESCCNVVQHVGNNCVGKRMTFGFSFCRSRDIGEFYSSFRIEHASSYFKGAIQASKIAKLHSLRPVPPDRLTLGFESKNLF